MAISAPSDISGLVLDLDPHEASYQDTAGTTPAGAGDSVARVDDQTGGGLHHTQSTAANRPTLQQDGNGWLALLADGSNDVLTHATSFNWGAFTLVAVAVPESGAINDSQCLWSGNNYVAGAAMVWTDSVARCDVFANGSVDTQTGAVGSNRHVFASVYDGAALTSYVNNTGAGSAVSGTASVTSPVGLLDRPAGGRGFKGQLYRFLVYSKALSSTERTDLYDYLSALYASPPPGDGGDSVLLPFMMHMHG